MDELTLAETLIKKVEAAVSVPVKTKGGGSHESPVILLADLDATRIARGNSSKAGYTYDSNGNIDGHRFEHQYEATPRFVARSTDEVQSYKLATTVRNYLTFYENYVNQLHTDATGFTVGKVTQTDPQVDPLPEPTYKHYVTMSVTYTHEVTRSLDSDDPQEIDSFTDSVTTDETLE